MTSLLNKKTGIILSSLIFTIGILLTGCGSEQQQAAGKVAVKAMKIEKQNAPVSYWYPGQLKGTDDVEVHSRVSGSIMEKYFKGGDIVHKGDPLYRIDSRQYESEVIQAEANLHKAESELRNAQEDLARDEMLWHDKAISEQTVTNQRATVAGYMATVESYRAALKKAHENLDDVMVYAPMDGKLSVDDVAVGTYATAGTTKLVTIGSSNPIYAQFSISEAEYLEILAEADERGAFDKPKLDYTPPKVRIKLSNGFDYPFEGEITAINRAMTDNSGSLTVKALFSNPREVLLPGMFARIGFVDIVTPNAILVPQRCVQQLLDETFVLVVGEDGKSVSKKVVLGEKVGSYYIIKSGISAGDNVIVEGLTNLQSGKELDVTMVTAKDMGFSLKESDEIVNKS